MVLGGGRTEGRPVNEQKEIVGERLEGDVFAVALASGDQPVVTVDGKDLSEWIHEVLGREPNRTAHTQLGKIALSVEVLGERKGD